MRSITFTLLLLAVVLLTSATEEPKCKSRCLCPRFYAPVCGISGKTHPNACFAKCSNDIVRMKGPCPQACKRTINKLSKCVMAKYGRNGTRKRCCNWSQEGNKIINKRCKWVGKANYTFVRTNCYWKSKGHGKKQRFCCSQQVSKRGIKTRVGSKKCTFVGTVLETSLKQNCAWKPFGKNGKRKYCCKTKTECSGKDCKTQNSKCAYIGPIVEYRNLTLCKWKKTSLTKTRRQCCNVSRRCVRNPHLNKSVCKSKVGQCKFVGKAIVSRDQSSCHWRQYGNKGRRQRCCTWKKVCSKGYCRSKKFNCQWKGCVVRTNRKVECKWVTKSDGMKQKYCCEKKNVCKCQKCATIQTSCRFVGKSFSTKKTVGCHWKITSKNGRRRRCCKHEVRCVGKKCTKKTACKLVGLELKNYIFEKCKWKHFAKYQKRKMCCEYQKNCVGASCKTKLLKCRFAGDIITSTRENGCTFRKLSLTHSRKYCCSKVKTCEGKKCSYKKKECSYKGPMISKTPKKSCFTRKYGNPLSTRKFCCNWHEFCYGKQCRPINRKCSWEGKIRQRFLKSECKWTKKTKLNTVQVRCCNWVRTCETLTLNREENCTNSKKRCRFVGKIVNTKSLNRCSFKPIGLNSRRLRCCEFKKTCTGKNCSTKKTNKCHWKGPIHKETIHTKCHWKRTGKKSQKRECCTWRVSCVGPKCSKVKKTCVFVGKSVGKGRKYGGGYCRWRLFRSNKNGLSKRQFCCRKVLECSKNGEDKSCKRIGRCTWFGYSVPLEKKFYKKSASCRVNGKSKFCCQQISQCVRVGNSQPKCRLIKNICNSQIVNKKPKRKFSSCVTFGKSQIKTFKGKKFQNVFKGSFKLVHNRHIKVHTQVKRINGNPRTVGFAARIKGVLIQSISRNNDALLLHRKKVLHLKVGKTKIVKGVKITKVHKNRIHFDAGKKGRIIVSTKKLKNSKFSRHKITVRVVQTKKTKGFCVGEHMISKGKGLFNHILKDVKKPMKKFKYYAPCPKGTARIAVILCRRTGVKGIKFGTCISRKCHKLSKEDIIKAKKIQALERGVPSKKICLATGDPFFSNIHKKKFSRHVAGDRVLYGSKSFSVHARVKKNKKQQFAITGFAVKVNRQRTVVENGKRNGRFLIKGKPVLVKVGKTLKLKNGGSIQRITKDKTLITGSKGQVVTVNRLKLSNKRVVYNIVTVFKKVAKSSKGLCVDHKHKKFGKDLFKKPYRPNERKSDIKKCHVSVRQFFFFECNKQFKNDNAKVLKCVMRKCLFPMRAVPQPKVVTKPKVVKPVVTKPTQPKKPTQPVQVTKSNLVKEVTPKKSQKVNQVVKDDGMNKLKPKKHLPIYVVPKENN